MRSLRAGLAAGLFALALGCAGGPATGDVSGTITVDGQVPADGSSINFIPTDGKAPTAGATLDKGKYTAKVPVGTSKVQIWVPRPVGGAPKPKAKDGYQTEGQIVEESLLEKYNEKTELTFEVKPGRQEKNWEVSAKK